MPQVKLLDRKNEIATLENAWSEARRGQPQLTVIWERRRVGKTFLLSAFTHLRRMGQWHAFGSANRQEDNVTTLHRARARRENRHHRRAGSYSKRPHPVATFPAASTAVTEST